jgi:hypothetical protein
MGGSSKQTIGQRYFAKLTTFIGNPIEKLIGINFDNRGWLFKPDNDESFLRVESPNLYGDKEGGVAGFIDIHTGTADQLPNSTYEKDFPKVSGYPFQSYLVFRGLGKKPATSGGIGQFTQGSPKHYNGSFYHGNSGYMKEMLLWPQRIHVRNDGRPQWYDEKAEIPDIVEEFDKQQNILFKTKISVDSSLPSDVSLEYLASTTPELDYRIEQSFGTTGFNIEGIQINAAFSAVATGLATLSFEIESLKTSATEISVNNIVIHSSEVVEDNQLIETKKYVGIAYFNDFSIKCIATPDSNNQATLILKNISFSGYKSWRVEKSSINPIHKIREILTDDTAMNKPESDVNDANFKKAADVLFEENIGISWSVTEKSCLEAINELCGHIEAGVRVNRQTGLYEMVLFRDDWFDDDEIHTLPINKIKSMQLDGATSADELINKLNVSYYNREAIKNSSFSVAEIAAIRNLKGRENSEDVKFPYFMNQRNAAVVAQWKLKQMSTPVWQGTFTTGSYEARKWNRYDLLRLEWPRKWTGTILVRIMKINLGTGTDVSIDFVEVVPYSSNLSSSIGIDTPVDTTPKPPQPALFKAFELSYLEAVQLNGQKAVDEALAYNPDAGYAAVVAQRPQSNSLSALMYTNAGSDYERVGVLAYSETAELDQNISQLNTSFIVKNASDIDMVSIGTQITINNEIMVYESYDAETKLLVVKRGALDTVPQKHLAGSVLYFADDFITVDPTEYVTSEEVDVKVLTTTPSGILSLDQVEAQRVEIQARMIRPYPPANVKINDVAWPETLLVTSDLTVTWVHRNRLQQTGGALLGFYDGGIAVESGVTYSLELSAAAGDVLLFEENIAGVTLTIPKALIVPNKVHKLKLWAVRDGYTSYQVVEHSFFAEAASLILTATATKSNVAGNTVPNANLTVNIDSSLTAKMQFDGSAIKGKAPAGSAITIEIED